MSRVLGLRYKQQSFTNKRKTIIFVILLSLTTTFARSQNTITIHYKETVNTSAPGANAYSMDIPQGFKLMTLVGGHNEVEKQYIYPDSAKIYISDFENGSLNYKHIMLLGDSIASKRFVNIKLKAALARELQQQYTDETIMLQGKTEDGLYWKDVRNGDINIGYKNVRKSDKIKFDKALASFSNK